MLIQGSALTNRKDILIKKYCSLLEEGIKAEEILVLLENPLKKEYFINRVKKNLSISHFENAQIHTFYGLCRSTILNFWPEIENMINDKNSIITPHLTGLEISQFLIKHSVQEAGFKDYNSKLNLIHQIFRRFSLITNNNLSKEDVKKRSFVLKEVFHEDASSAIEKYKLKTLQYRAFDYIRQVSIFNRLYKQVDCFKNIKYLIIDDADEITNAEFDFIKHIKPQLKDICIGYDKLGSSRLGYLNTDVKIIEKTENLFKDEQIINLDNIEFTNADIEQHSFTKRLEMIEKAFNKATDLIKSGVKASDIAIIVPVSDTALKFVAKEFFEPASINYQFISGSEKLCDDNTVKAALVILKLSLGISVEPTEIRAILGNILNIPLKYCLPIIQEYKKSSKIKFFDLGYETYSQKLDDFIKILDKITESSLTLSEKLIFLYENLFLETTTLSNMDKFVFFVKQIQDFETVFSKNKEDIIFQKTILSQLSNSIISENPSSAPDIKQNAIIISTAQKIIDFSLKTKYQIWLDTTSHEWQHDDFGTLYNAWVFQSSWDKESFTNDDNLKYSELKTKKMLRKLSILASDKIYAYSSTYDKLGCENTGTTEEIFLSLYKKKQHPKEETNKINFQFIPREDQKPVLDYQNSSLAISAVPGAGKTTVLLALIINLLKKGVQSENIFVLTYMDSAARNFKERIKKACPDLEKLPNISTIHGLALRILKENTNYVLAGLDENFEVCDDIQRERIIREAILFSKLDNEDYEKYEKGISLLKFSNINKIPYTKDIEIQKFLKVYKAYNSILKSKNLIDYDDMLSYSVKILKNNPEIADYYKNICHYVIEDEAQDSSYIQQELISILSFKHKNLIRCGDINQSITTTFTNTNLEGFRNFITNNKTVSMTQSQRCAKGIYELANKLVKLSATKNDLRKAFYPMEMKEVNGKNPVSKNAVSAKIFNDYQEENLYILDKIRKIYTANPHANIAILVRYNYQIEEYSSYFSNYGYNIVSGNDTLNKQPVFNLIFSLLKFCSHPWDNETVLQFAKTLSEQRLLLLQESDFEYIKQQKTPFILQKDEYLPSQNLCQILWDLNYWLENSSLEILDFAVKTGNYYYNTDVEKSNIYITAEFLKSISQQYSTREALIEKLDEIKNRPMSTKFRFFEDEKYKKNSTKSTGFLRIMTYHKSKGDEFDYVFIPALNEEFLQFNPENVKIKSKERFLENIKALNYNYTKKDEKALKLFQIEENLRLLYVAITRAKKELFISTAKKYKKFSRIKNAELSEIMQELLNWQNTDEVANAQ